MCVCGNSIVHFFRLCKVVGMSIVRDVECVLLWIVCGVTYFLYGIDVE